MEIGKEAWINGELQYQPHFNTASLVKENEECMSVYEGSLLLGSKEFYSICEEFIKRYQNFVEKDENIDPPRRHSQISKQLCQAIAKTLWHLDPTMTIEELKNHHAIQEYGNGKRYRGKNTLRDWLSEVDPRPEGQKTGRSKKNTC